jgi:hypothetical protein
MVVAVGVQAAGASADRMALLAPALQNAARQATQLGITPEAALAAFRRALQQNPEEQP